jgi:hypothetical protein
MPTVTFTLSAEHLTRAVNALGHDYQAEIQDPNDSTKLIPNPETKPAYAKRKIREWIVGQTLRFEEAEAKKAAETGLTSITITE